MAAGLAIAVVASASSAVQARPTTLPPGSKYVSMGSSFASGPRITTSADSPPSRCARSRDNYAHQLARRLQLDLVDVSCSGATTAHLLGPWNELPAQLDAIDTRTRLVTVTVGGNDVRYSAGLSAMGCRTSGGQQCNDVPPPPTDADVAALEARLTRIAQEVHRRAPRARLVFVDYPTVLPPSGTCPALSLTVAQADASRAVNRRVVEITARVARATGSDLVAASGLSGDHNACSAAPWTNGYPAPDAPTDGAAFHPRLAAHTAIAEELARRLSR